MSATHAWLLLIHDVLTLGEEVAPRGKLTKEILQHTIELDMSHPVVCVPDRKLSYQFMMAEAYWILTGDDSLAGIGPFNKHIHEYSDDGVKFFGAYGPKVVDQLPYVVEKLLQDISTRQAVINIWREKPPATKDVPCTVAMSFMARGGWLNCHVFMRSNDVWLGTPYDVFSFSMVAHLVCARFNESQGNPRGLRPGRLFVTAASSHMYEPNWGQADKLYHNTVGIDGLSAPVPDLMWQDSTHLVLELERLRSSSPGDDDRWWEHKR